MAIEIVDFPLNMVMFHSYVSLPEGNGGVRFVIQLDHEFVSINKHGDLGMPDFKNPRFGFMVLAEHGPNSDGIYGMYTKWGPLDS